MATSLPELKFRRFITESDIDQYWMMTWHEDREISPGVPDLHFVMKGAPGEQYRVGWLELKALDSNITPSQRVKVEPSQHQYLRRWAPRMPIYFLIRIKGWVFVVPGAYHRELTDATCEADLKVLSVLDFEQSLISEALPPFLKEITKI